MTISKSAVRFFLAFPLIPALVFLVLGALSTIAHTYFSMSLNKFQGCIGFSVAVSLTVSYVLIRLWFPEFYQPGSITLSSDDDEFMYSLKDEVYGYHRYDRDHDLTTNDSYDTDRYEPYDFGR